MNADIATVDSSAGAGPAERVPLVPIPAGIRAGYLGAADFFRILRRRRTLILAVMGIAILLSMILIVRTKPTYSAIATVVVQPPDPAAQAGAPVAGGNPSEESRIETKVQILKSTVLARRTAQSLHLIDDPEFAPPRDDSGGFVDHILAWFVPPPPPLADPKERAAAAERARQQAVAEKLVDQLDISRVERSNLISITATANDPHKAALIANRLVDIYVRGQIDDAKETRDREISALSRQVASVRADLQQTDTTAAAYRRQHGLLSARPEDSGNTQVNQISGLLAQAREESAADSRRAAQSMLSDGGTTASSPLLTDLRQQEALLERKKAELGTFFGAGYPEVARTSSELAAIRLKIGAEIQRIGADLNTQAAASQARSGAASGSIAAVKGQSLADGTAAVPLRALERNGDASHSLYVSLLTLLNQKIGSQPDDDSDISFVSRAAAPDMPSHPLPKRILAVAVLASAILGMILALVTEMMDTKLRTTEQASRILGLPTLAMIPDLGAENGVSIYRAIDVRPRSHFSEAMRSLLIELEGLRGDARTHVVVVTSPLGREGKNTIATSLAAAAAVIGRNAVVVDFDLRRPGLTETARARPTGAGVVAFLANNAVVDDLVTIEDESRFSMIGAGDTPSDPGALIASPRLPILVSELRERYDLVILNAPPILPVRDAKALADLADSTILVLRWGKTSPEAARIAVELFDRPIAGAVFNMVDYAVHARRRYGDAIHHVARSSDYFGEDAYPSRWPVLGRAGASARRLASRAASALHLA